jgi:hypothetical protein
MEPQQRPGAPAEDTKGSGSKAGRPKERPEGEHPLTARLPVKTYRTLKLLAAANGVPLNKALTAAVEEWIVRQPGHEALASVVDQTITAKSSEG